MTRICRTASAGTCAVVLFFLLFPILSARSEAVKTVKERILFSPANVSVLAEKADTPEKRSQGLMFRPSLGEKEAMIFYFDESAYHTFWMHNTRVPLTVIFLDEGFRVVDMIDMSPCLEKNADLCPLYTSRGLARYAIEVNRGFAEKYGVRVGDRARIERTRGY